MDSVTVRNQIKLQHWSTVIRSRNESSLKLNEWLRENNISKDAYYYWKRKLRDRALDTVGVPFVEVAAPAHEEQTAVMADASQEGSAMLQISGMTISINESASTEFMKRLITAARHAE